jgi:hypothetical protein
MKQIVLIFLSLTILGCKNSSQNDNSQAILIKGNYIYFHDAAVLQTDSEIYGVYINTKVEELNQQAEAHKADSTDMVYVEVKGLVSTTPDQIILWEKKLEITEIISVSPIKTNNTINLVTE